MVYSNGRVPARGEEREEERAAEGREVRSYVVEGPTGGPEGRQTA